MEKEESKDLQVQGSNNAKNKIRPRRSNIHTENEIFTDYGDVKKHLDELRYLLNKNDFHKLMLLNDWIKT